MQLCQLNFLFFAALLFISLQVFISLNSKANYLNHVPVIGYLDASPRSELLIGIDYLSVESKYLGFDTASIIVGFDKLVLNHVNETWWPTPGEAIVTREVKVRSPYSLFIHLCLCSDRYAMRVCVYSLWILYVYSFQQQQHAYPTNHSS
jgi:hypothetical protein